MEYCKFSWIMSRPYDNKGSKQKLLQMDSLCSVGTGTRFKLPARSNFFRISTVYLELRAWSSSTEARGINISSKRNFERVLPEVFHFNFSRDEMNEENPRLYQERQRSLVGRRKTHWRLIHVHWNVHKHEHENAIYRRRQSRIILRICRIFIHTGRYDTHSLTR